MSHRIHTFGASGSGTTTLARALSDQLNCEHLDTDDYYWLKSDPPYIKKRDPVERVKLIQEKVAGKKSWTLSGSICSWGDPLLDSFTLAVFVLLDTDVRMKRLEKRERERHGSRIDRGGDMYKAHLEFMEWARSYDTATTPIRRLEMHQSWTEKLRCPVVEVNSIEDRKSIAIQILSQAH